jgi:hypothetical protein
VSTVQRSLRVLKDGGLVVERWRDGGAGRGRPMNRVDVARSA